MAYFRLKSEAILLRAVDFGESDRIVHLLTPRTGRLTAIAKGARRSVKRFAGTLDLCNLLRVQVEQRRRSSMARLDQATLVHPYLGLRAQPVRFALACTLIEVVDRMAPEGGARDDLAAHLPTLRGWRCGWSRPQAGDSRRSACATLLELRDSRRAGPSTRALASASRAANRRRPAGVTSCASASPTAASCVERARCAWSGAEGLLSLHLGTLRRRSSGRSRSRSMDSPRLAIPPAALVEAQHVVARFQRFHVGIELRSERVLDGLDGREGALGAASRGPFAGFSGHVGAAR